MALRERGLGREREREGERLGPTLICFSAILHGSTLWNICLSGLGEVVLSCLILIPSTRTSVDPFEGYPRLSHWLSVVEGEFFHTCDLSSIPQAFFRYLLGPKGRDYPKDKAWFTSMGLPERTAQPWLPLLLLIARGLWPRFLPRWVGELYNFTHIVVTAECLKWKILLMGL